MRELKSHALIAAVVMLGLVNNPACRSQTASPPPASRPSTEAPPAALPAPSTPAPPALPSQAAKPAQPLAPSSPPTPLPAIEGKATNLKAASLEEGDMPLPINLAAALRLSDARPLIIAAAQAGTWVAEAQLQRAQVLWVPQLNIGFDYYRHDGNGPDFKNGNNVPTNPLQENFNFLYAGGGLTQMNAGTDIIFEPLAARQLVNSRRWDIQTAKNDALLQTAQAYFSVHRWRGSYAGALNVVERGRKLVERVTALSTDLVPKAEINRARNALADFEQQATSAREQWRVSSADLTFVLRLDPRTVAVPLEHDHLQITLFDPARPLDDLIPIGLTNRPELASQQALVQQVLVRIRQEKLRPLIPSVLITGFQTPGELLEVGGVGVGHDGSLNNWTSRDDISPQVLWQAEAMGLGNLARVKEQRGEQSRTLVQLFRIQDGVAADIARTQARLQSAAARVLQADRSLREALITYEKNYEGLRQTTRFGNILVQVYRPQEAVVALEHLSTSYDRYFSTVADYNQAEFQMFHALGYPARDVATFRPPGEAIPVDVTRPPSLPGVDSGPPPATR